MSIVVVGLALGGYGWRVGELGGVVAVLVCFGFLEVGLMVFVVVARGFV